MNWIAWILSLAFLSAMNVSANDSEKATYVGGGRYVGEGRSVDDAMLRQRNNEYTERQYDRQESNRRYDSYEYQEREYDYDRQGRDWSEY